MNTVINVTKGIIIKSGRGVFFIYSYSQDPWGILLKSDFLKLTVDSLLTSDFFFYGLLLIFLKVYWVLTSKVGANLYRCGPSAATRWRLDARSTADWSQTTARTSGLTTAGSGRGQIGLIKRRGVHITFKPRYTCITGIFTSDTSNYFIYIWYMYITKLTIPLRIFMFNRYIHFQCYMQRVFVPVRNTCWRPRWYPGASGWRQRSASLSVCWTHAAHAHQNLSVKKIQETEIHTKWKPYNNIKTVLV